ncbi:hypothetical protein DRF65_16620 [Chryseobacterium pennae]|uniref:EF-hand domain-containing protein n=1 Tax=Chryseobacterium pennae TaxID=2258962 RepID=A0A3D9C6L7_9FLAO|nr:hypothetical protein [Chryseobacterium pennae]REC61338.1 hypothetical protein DRF65_16620 [Chryseobacterium pennae]
MKNSNLYRNFKDALNKGLNINNRELLYKISFLEKKEIDNILSSSEMDNITEDKIIHVLHCIELILDENAIYSLKKTLDFVNELYSDPGFRIDENEDGELDEKDIEQLIELKREFVEDVENKINVLQMYKI